MIVLTAMIEEPQMIALPGRDERSIRGLEVEQLKKSRVLPPHRPELNAFSREVLVHSRKR